MGAPVPDNSPALKASCIGAWISKCVPAGMGAVSCPRCIRLVRRWDNRTCHFCWSVGWEGWGGWVAGVGETVIDCIGSTDINGV